MFLVLGTIIAFLNISNYSTLVNRADEIISISEKLKISPEDRFKMKDQPIIIDYSENNISKYFIDGNIKVDLLNYNIEFDGNSFEDLTIDNVKELISKNKIRGFFSSFRYYNNQDTELRYILPFERDIQFFKNTLTNSFLVFLISILVSIILVFIISKQAIKPMVESYDKQKKFITDASHELKTPISIINSSVELLEMDPQDRQWLKKIKVANQKLNSLVTDLLSLSRMDENNIKADFELIDISQLLSDLTDYYEPLFEIKGCKLNVDCKNDLTIFADKKQIVRVFHILLDNASKYALDNSEVYFKISKKGKKMLIVSKNQAVDLHKGDYNQIFERFTRLDSSRNSEKGGYGIGLAMLAAIVQLHKGKTTASSDGKFLEIKIEI